MNQVELNKNRILTYVLDRRGIREMAKVISISLAIYYVAHKIYVGFFGPLAKLPGPFITRFTPMPNLLYTVIKGTRFKLFKSLHEKYGRVVRLSPNSLTVSDKNMVKQILVTDDLMKAPHYKNFSAQRSPNLFSTRDKVFHKQRRRIVSPAFSTKYLSSLEPFMASVARSFLEKISKDIEKTKDSEGFGVVDIWILYQCFALDVIGETAFGQTFNMIENNSHFVPKAISDDLKSAAIGNMTPFFVKMFLKDTQKMNPELEKFMKKVILDRMSIQEGEKRKDILQWLIDSQKAYTSEDRLTADAIISETVLFLTAGSETTSNTLGFAIYELLRHPETLKKLVDEIDQIPFEDEEKKLFNHEQLKRLPYLNAVINETLRLDTVAAGGLGRVTTEKTVLGGQYVLPKGIVLHANIYDTQTSEDYWERPLDFLPERWLSEETNIKLADSDAFHPFSSGSRNCIGKNFALQEMRLALSVLLKHFEIAPIEQELKDAEDRRGFITLRVNKNSLKIRIRHRSH